MRYLVIEEMKPGESVPSRLVKRYGLVDVSTGKVILPIEYDSILVKEKGGFVWTQRVNSDFTNTCEVYQIMANGDLSRVSEDDPTDFIWSIYGTDIKVLRIKGTIHVMKTLDECID